MYQLFVNAAQNAANIDVYKNPHKDYVSVSNSMRIAPTATRPTGIVELLKIILLPAALHTDHTISVIVSALGLTDQRNIIETDTTTNANDVLQDVKPKCQLRASYFKENLTEVFNTPVPEGWVCLNVLESTLRLTPRHKLKILFNAEKKRIWVWDSREEGFNERLRKIATALPAIMKLALPPELISWYSEASAIGQLDFTGPLSDRAQTLIAQLKKVLHPEGFLEREQARAIKATLMSFNQRQIGILNSHVRQYEDKAAQLEEQHRETVVLLNQAVTLAAQGFLPTQDLDLLTKALQTSEHIFKLENTALKIQVITPVCLSDDMLFKRKLANRISLTPLEQKVVLDVLVAQTQYTMYFTEQVSCDSNGVRILRRGPRLIQTWGMHNTHIDRYNCYTQAAVAINKAMQTGLYMAFMQAVYAIGDLVVQDAIVQEAFLHGIKSQLRGEAAPIVCIMDNNTKEKLTWKDVYDREKNKTEQTRPEGGSEAAVNSDATDTTANTANPATDEFNPFAAV